jgi:hypothetical protein
MNVLYINYYLIGGVIVCVLLVGWWILRSIAGLKNTYAQHGSLPDDADAAGRDHDPDHRALMLLMTQKTDSVLAALARTIEAERQKLGIVVRKPSTGETIEASQAPEVHGCENGPPPHDRILPMAGSGVGVAAIARQLRLPEAEVAAVVRLNAA